VNVCSGSSCYVSNKEEQEEEEEGGRVGGDCDYTALISDSGCVFKVLSRK